MTAPIGFRTVLPPTSAPGASRPAVPPAGIPLPEPLNVVEELAAAGSRQIPKDHLDLIRALIEAGKFPRAIELLDAVWRLDSEHEQAWFYRLWATIGEGKAGAALDLVRTVTPRLPGSAAIAWMHAHLEEYGGDPRAALEAALRASAAAPHRQEAMALVQRLVRLVAEEAGGRPGESAQPEVQVGQPAQPGTLSLLGAALQGAALLYPPGSPKSHLAVLPPRIRQPDAIVAPKSTVAKRFGLLALATVIAALWAIPDPLPAAVALAVVVVFVTRLYRPPAGR